MIFFFFLKSPHSGFLFLFLNKFSFSFFFFNFIKGIFITGGHWQILVV
jgi:hypothetical protein